MFTVKEKVAIVFGGNGAIGRCTIIELFKHGVKSVLIVDQNDTNVIAFIQNEISSIYGEKRATFMKFNVANLTEVQGVFDFCIQQFGHLDIVINCVGVINEELGPASNIKINLIGAAHIINEAYTRLPTCKSSTTEEGVICSVASLAGLWPLVNFPNYSASKSGLITYSYCMGKHKEMEGDVSVRIVTLCPTATNTPLLDYGRNLCDTTTGDIQTNMIKLFREEHQQKPESAAKCILQIIQHGENASFWLSHKDNNAKQLDYAAILALAISPLQD